jgi:hypothetical protein
MGNLLLHLLGRRIVNKAVAKRAGRGRALDLGFGFALLRDRRIALGTKLLALSLGASLMLLIVALELPMESVWAMLLPFFGLGLDGVMDGMEMLIGPILFAALLLPFLAPKALVQQLHEERQGWTTPAAMGDGPVIDVESHAPAP